MGNSQTKGSYKSRQKKQVHWKAAERPLPPGKPHLVPGADITPDVVTIKWDKPKSDGGSPITGYLVEHRRTGSPHWVRATPLLIPNAELTLSGLEPGWRYQFRVSAQNAVGMSDPGEMSEPLTVTLQRSVTTAPKFTEELQNKTTLENEMVEFMVHFIGQPSPKICWFKDGFEIFSSRRTRIITDSNKSVLKIHQVALADEGEIKCTATNKAGHASTKIAMKVEAPPVIRLPRQYEEGLLFELDEVIRLKVSIAGRPQPLVFWTHNGESIQNDERCEVTNSDRASSLRINEAKRSDRGEYQIRAVNTIGEDSTSFLVTVTDKPKAPPNLKVAMTLGKSVSLAWEEPEDDGGCKIGNYIVEYYRLGWNVWLKAATSRKLATTLTDLIEGSEYKFRVKAESPYGVSGPSNETDVVFIPDPKRGILSPPIRSRSQPRDIIQDNYPVPPKRRSASSTRNSNREQLATLISSSIPIPPKREKIKSPQKTPEQSPQINRRHQNNNNKLYDRSSLARELSYGSPDIKIKKSDLKNQHCEQVNKSPILGKRDKSPSRINQFLSNILPKKSPSPSPSLTEKNSLPNTPSPVTEHKEFINMNSLKGDHLERLSPKVINRRLSSPMILSRTDNSQINPDVLRRSRSPSLFVNTSQKTSDYVLDQYNRSPSPNTMLREQSPSPNPIINTQPYTPDIVLRKERSPSPLPIVRNRSPSPAPMLKEKSPSPEPVSKERSPSPSRFSLNSDQELKRDFNQPRLNNTNDLLHGSSEFMLVLLEDQDMPSNYFHFDDNMIPPPMSLSAPELGFDSLLFAPMKTCASSSELLHERTFSRFATEAEEESKAMFNKNMLGKRDSLKTNENDDRRLSIPKILINSKDDEEIVGLERKSSFTRRLSAGVTNLAQQFNWAKRRQSLGTTEENTNLFDLKSKFSGKLKDIAEKKIPITEEKKSKNTKTDIMDKWSEDEESTDEESSISSEESESDDDKLEHTAFAPNITVPEEEIYHPKIMNQFLSKNNEPFEILSKPSPLPDPNFVPKPILKQRNDDKKTMLEKPVRKFTPGHELSPFSSDKSQTPSPPQTPPARTVLQTHMMSAAEAAKNKRIVNRHIAQEESRVVADHYADIVRQYGNQKSQSTKLYLDRDELKSAADLEEDTLRIATKQDIIYLKNQEVPVRTSPSSTRNSTPRAKYPSRSSSHSRDQQRPLTPSKLHMKEIVSRTPSPRPLTPEQEALQAEAEIIVRSTVDYMTDVAMFIVACWLYLFKDARFAIPVLLIMVYRQLKDEMKKLLAGWLIKTKKS